MIVCVGDGGGIRVNLFLRKVGFDDARFTLRAAGGRSRPGLSWGGSYHHQRKGGVFVAA
jgi:hypothetical protein